MENNSSINLNNNIFYNDNNVENYEELACCNNSVITTFIQENGNNILNFLIDLCSRNMSIDEEAQIINNSENKVKTPLCSDNIKNRDIFNNDNIINNFADNNSINNQNEHNSLNNSHNSEIINPSNEEAAEPIMSTKKYDNMVDQSKKRNKNNLHRNRTNFFNVLKDVFKDFFNDNKKEDNPDKEDNKSDSQINLDLDRRPILKRIIERDFLSSFKLNLNHQNNKNKINLNHSNTYVFKRPQLYAEDILTFNISEENHDETVTKLVSYIPVFTVKEKNITKEGNNKCAICLSDFEVGQKKSTLPCLHSFHYVCFERWIKNKKYCPICKFQISFESLKKSVEINYK
jgi:E3 ubiquitin-protein ligase SDIR1